MYLCPNAIWEGTTAIPVLIAGNMTVNSDILSISIVLVLQKKNRRQDNPTALFFTPEPV